MTDFDHKKLDVYNAFIEFVTLCDCLIHDFPSDRSYLTNQLRRASLSILLNIAEGTGEFSILEKARFYRIALRSATECATILDIFLALNFQDQRSLSHGNSFLLRIVAMLTKMK